MIRVTHVPQLNTKTSGFRKVESTADFSTNLVDASASFSRISFTTVLYTHIHTCDHVSLTATVVRFLGANPFNKLRKHMFSKYSTKMKGED